MPATPEPRAPRRVLYVEDHPVNAMLMSAMFDRRPELSLVIAVDGRQALSLARGLEPALLLLDLRLPDCHGSQLLPLLRQVPGCAGAPAVAVTADGDFDITGTGFSELWAKPLRLDEVLQRLDALLGPQRGSPPDAPTLSRRAAAGMTSGHTPSLVPSWR